MITENTLRVKLEVAGDGQMKASLLDNAGALDTLEKAQEAVTEAAGAMADAQTQATAATEAAGETAEDAAARIRAMVQASRERAETERAAAETSQRSTQAAASATVGLDRLVQAQNRAMAGATRMVQEEQRAAQAAAQAAGVSQQREELEKLVGQIDPTIAALHRLDLQQQQLKDFHAAGVLGTDDYRHFNEVIDASRNRITAAGEAMHSFSLNNANARRELGYIVKDLATGQWGRAQQSFLTLASSSGALGAALTGIGAGIAGVVAELGVFGFAAAQAYTEEQALNRAVAQTGNTAELTAGSVDRMAAQIGSATNRAGQAREILTQLAANGKVGSESMLALGQAAFDMAQLTGASADQAASKVTSLFDGTAASALKANEQYHFLTASVYEQIAAFEREGDAQGAARVAAEAFHDAVGPRIQQMNDQVYGLARAWDEVTSATRGWWQEFKTGAALLAGTADLDTRIFALQGKQEAAANHDYSLVGKARNLFFGSGLVDRADSSFVQFTPEDEAELKRLLQERNERQKQIEKDAEDQRVQDEGVRAQAELQRISDTHKTSEQRRQDEIIKIHNLANAAIAAALAKGDKALAEKLLQQEVAADAAARRDGNRRSASDPMAGLDRLVAGAYAQNSTVGVRQIDLQAAALREIAEAGGAAIAKGADLSTVQAKVAAAVEQTTQFYGRQTDEVERAAAAEQAYRAAMEQKLQVYQQEAQLRVDGIGMSQREIALERELIAIQREAAQERAQLTRQHDAGHLTDDQYATRLRDVEEFETRRVVASRQADADIAAAQGDWTLGAVAALKDYRDQALDIAGQVRQGFGGMFGDMEDALATWVETGKLSLDNFAKNFADMVLRMELRALEAQAAGALLSWLAPGAGSYTSLGGSAASYSGIGSTGSFTGGFNLATAGTGHADGGRIRGPGTGTSDSIPAWLSDGENVITAKATNYYGQRFMDDINAMRLPRFAQGGRVGGPGAGAGAAAPTIIVENNNGSDVKPSAQQQPDGSFLIRLAINAVADDITRGGPTAKALGARFGLQRRGAPVSGA